MIDCVPVHVHTVLHVTSVCMYVFVYGYEVVVFIHFMSCSVYQYIKSCTGEN